jgi:hypothetical protein
LFAVCAGKDFEARRGTALLMMLLDAGPRRGELLGMRLGCGSATSTPSSVSKLTYCLTNAGCSSSIWSVTTWSSTPGSGSILAPERSLLPEWRPSIWALRVARSVIASR